MHLQEKEKEILNYLIRAERPLAISEIVASNPAYTTNIVQPIIRKLSGMGLVEVDSIVFNKKALTRTFRPTANVSSVLQELFQKEYLSFRQLFSDNSLLASMVQTEIDTTNDEEEILQLKQILESFRTNVK